MILNYKYQNTCCCPPCSCQLRDANRSLDMVVYRCGMALIFADYWRVIRLLIAEDMLARLTCINSTSSQAPSGRFFYRAVLGRVLWKSQVGGQLGFRQISLYPIYVRVFVAISGISGWCPGIVYPVYPIFRVTKYPMIFKTGSRQVSYRKNVR